MTRRKRLLAWIPALDSLRDYSWTSLRHDTVAGVTVAAVAVPQAMAYASIFGMPVQYGLYTAIVMTAAGALLSSSKQLINGPTNAISIAMLSALATVPPEHHVDTAILMALMIGVLQIGITLTRFGDLSRYVSHAVIVGFTLGASTLLLLDQSKNVLGLKSVGTPHDHFLWRLYRTYTEGGPIHVRTVIISAVTMVLVIGLRWCQRRLGWRVPELLLALLFVSLLTAILDWGASGVALIPKIPRDLPAFRWPVFRWTYVRELADSALAIGLLGLLEAIAMSKSIAVQTRQKLDLQQLCLSEGVANLTGSFFQCFPGSGSLTRSYINYQAGGVSQWSGIISAVTVALTIVALAPLAQYIPRAGLAAILMISGLRMVDRQQLAYHCRATQFDMMIVICTAVSAVLVSVEFCILIGVLLSFVFYVPKAAHVRVTELTMTSQRLIRERVDTDPICDRMRLYSIEGEWFFGSAPDVEQILESIELETVESVKVIILRVKYVRNPDAVCMHLLDDFLRRMDARGVTVALCGVRDGFATVLSNLGITQRLGPERIFTEKKEIWSSTLQAVQWGYRQLNQDLCAACPRRGNAAIEPSEWNYMI